MEWARSDDREMQATASEALAGFVIGQLSTWARNSSTGEKENRFVRHGVGNATQEEKEKKDNRFGETVMMLINESKENRKQKGGGELATMWDGCREVLLAGAYRASSETQHYWSSFFLAVGALSSPSLLRPLCRFAVSQINLSNDIGAPISLISQSRSLLYMIPLLGSMASCSGLERQLQKERKEEWEMIYCHMRAREAQGSTRKQREEIRQIVEECAVEIMAVVMKRLSLSSYIIYIYIYRDTLQGIYRSR